MEPRPPSSAPRLEAANDASHYRGKGYDHEQGEHTGFGDALGQQTGIRTTSGRTGSAVLQNGLTGLDRRQRRGDAQGSRSEEESGRARIRRERVRTTEGRIELARTGTGEA